MRHKKAGVKLNRTTSHRQAMFRNMVTSLLKHERIRTTDVKAKELRRWADQVITLAKRGDLHARRQVLAIVRETDVVHKLFAEAEKRYGHLNGGYTRIVKIGTRAGDAAPISLVELVALEEKSKKGKKKTKAAAKKKAAPAKAAVPAKEVEAKQEQPAQSAPTEAAAASPTDAAAEANTMESKGASEERDAEAPDPSPPQEEPSGASDAMDAEAEPKKE